jgi:hypothetical protein
MKLNGTDRKKNLPCKIKPHNQPTYVKATKQNTTQLTLRMAPRGAHVVGQWLAVHLIVVVLVAERDSGGIVGCGGRGDIRVLMLFR